MFLCGFCPLCLKKVYIASPVQSTAKTVFAG